MSPARVNEVHGQSLLNYWSTTKEAKGVICYSRYGSCLSVYREAFTSDENSNRGVPLVAVENILNEIHSYFSGKLQEYPS